MVSLYVDDLIYTGNNTLTCDEFKESMKKEFKMSNLGKMKFFLDVQVDQSKYGIHLCQKKYTTKGSASKIQYVKNHIVPGRRLTKHSNEKKVDAQAIQAACWQPSVSHCYKARHHVL